MSITAETRKLSLHPLAIHTFIKAQAGSLGKALSEAVMNSVDAFANSISVELTESGFVIEDNGQGFRSRDEIAAWFETLGFPHDDGNHRVYGKFGMGRAQMWAFARTVWRSNQFVMDVDVQRTGLDYKLDETSDRIAGTRIEAEFYEPLSFQALTLAEQELTNLIRFAPCMVTINGKMASKDPSMEKWDKEIPEAWMRFDKSMHTLDVYNGGVLVAHFPRYRFGCAGVVVTKPEHTLALNIARNEILVSECKVWPKILKELPKQNSDYVKSDRDKPVKPRPRDLAEMGRQVQAKVMTVEAALQKMPHLVISVNGRTIRYNDLVSTWGSSKVVFVPKGDEFGKRLSKLRLATVVASESLKNFGCSTVDELKALFRESIEKSTGTRADWKPHQLSSLDKAVWSDDPQSLFPDLAAGKKIFAQTELEDAEKATVAAWSRARTALSRMMYECMTEEQKKRIRLPSTVDLGDSPLDLSWVDKSSNSWVIRKKEVVAVMARPLPSMLQFALARVKELCEDISESQSEGQELFIKLSTETEAVATLALNLARFYVNECRSRDIPFTATRLSELDQLNVE